MMTLKIESAPLLLPPRVYAVCNPSHGCGRVFAVGPSKCPHCGRDVAAPSIVTQLFEALFNWEYAS